MADDLDAIHFEPTTDRLGYLADYAGRVILIHAAETRRRGRGESRFLRVSLANSEAGGMDAVRVPGPLWEAALRQLERAGGRPLIARVIRLGRGYSLGRP